MNKKQLKIIIALLAVIVVLLLVAGGLVIGLFVLAPQQKTPENATISADNGEWSLDNLKVGRVTAIDSDIQYSAYIGSIEEAEAELRAYGVEQREKYDNPKVEKIEKRIEKKYGIFAVNLGEMDVETAKDVEKAVKYMYKRYPMLKGKLTNITLSNINSFKNGHIALTQYREYIVNGDFSQTPYVMKFEILLSASMFLNREELLEKCTEGAETNYWPEGMDISTLVVHELSHQVLNAYMMNYFGYEDVYYVTDDNRDGFSYYITDGLKMNQTVAKMVVDEAYNQWEKDNPGKSYEDFCKSISGYAQGIKEDGGISYSETVAEALADIYLNGKKASKASQAIENVLIGK